MKPLYRESEQRIASILRFHGYNVYFPAEYKVPDAWDLPNHMWGLAVFEHDIEELDAADIVIVLYYGQETATGSIWEAGYACGKGKKVILVEMIGGIFHGNQRNIHIRHRARLPFDRNGLPIRCCGSLPAPRRRICRR